MCASGAVHVDCHGPVYACVGLLLHFDVVYGMDQRYYYLGWCFPGCGLVGFVSVCLISIF